jgi:hypothetical protein
MLHIFSFVALHGIIALAWRSIIKGMSRVAYATGG